MTPAPTDGRRQSNTLLLITLLVVAANLRAAITSVGPVLGPIAAETGLTEAQLGLLGSIPLLAFAAVSPLVQGLARRFGQERTVLIALLILVLATIYRSVPGWRGNLWLGTVVIGAAIAVGNVLVPAIVRQDFPDRIAVTTGAYSAVLSAFAALASGLSLPIARALGWRVAISCWAVLSVVAAVVWVPRLVRRAPGATVSATAPGSATSRPMWKSATAWQVALFMALQSTVFYLLITWLPTVEVAIGVSDVAAGWHLFLFQVAGIFAGIGVTAFMHGRGDLRLVAAGVSVLMVLAMVGLLLLPGAVVAWIVAAGLSAGSSLVVALTFVAQRVRTSADAGRLSGMVQGIGYLVASLGPLGAGLLLEATGAWQAPVVVAAAVASLQIVFALLAGRDRYTHPA